MIKKKRKFVAITTLIDKDILISGDTTYTGGIRIDGKINGNLKVNGEEGSLLIMGHGSKITGDVEVEKAIINGEINGNVKCNDYLELNTNAIVNGNIEYDIIEVHEGSKINGNLKVHGEEDSLLIMGHGSKITGDVEVEKAIINGEINGNIK